MTLSVIIVNYNVKYFLEQCLISVFQGLKGINGEVFVVDNASVDGSCQMIKQRFPEVNLIENKSNPGFSIANNQAIRIAKGEFVLLLNPDTVVEEDTFSKCIAFMREHPDAGSLAVKLIDGKGNYLPESKRSMPSPMVSFFKIFGLSRLFPRSKFFARYHLGHLDENQTQEIEILSGAFMFIRKAALDKVGLLDETFFMYGEDIDLSYRIINGGYKNYYYPETTIIHYKGESTKKGSINYVLIFYKAMMIFARKHFSKKNAWFYITLIYTAIYFRAALSIFKRFVIKLFQPTLDAAIMAVGFIVILPAWGKLQFQTASIYTTDTVTILIVSYIIIWLISGWMSGAYDRPQKLLAASKGIALGTLIILAGYGLLPPSMRFSRAIILITAFWSVFFVQIAHLLVGLYQKNMFTALNRHKRIAVVGNEMEVQRVLDILKQAGIESVFIGSISPSENITQKDQLATINQLSEFTRVNGVDEIIFCSADVSAQDIIKNMLILEPQGVDFKIAPPDSISIIGSNSIDTSGDLYTIDISTISKPDNRRKKRLLDVGLAITIALFAPVLALFLKRYGFVFVKALGVLLGQYTWVGYIEGDGVDLQGLPVIRKGVFPPIHGKRKDGIDAKVMERINILYAKNYSILTDLSIMWNNLR